MINTLICESHPYKNFYRAQLLRIKMTQSILFDAVELFRGDSDLQI